MNLKNQVEFFHLSQEGLLNGVAEPGCVAIIMLQPLRHSEKKTLSKDFLEAKKPSKKPVL